MSIKKTLNNKGMTLVSVMVAAAIGLVVMGGMFSMIMQVNKQMSLVTDKKFYEDMFEEVKEDFIRKNLCDTFLVNKSLNTGSAYVGLTAKAQNIAIGKESIDKELPYLSTRTNRLRFKKFDLKLIEKVGDSPDIYKSKIFLIAEKNNKLYTYSRPRSIIMNLKVESGKLTSCQSGLSGIIDSHFEKWKDPGYRHPNHANYVIHRDKSIEINIMYDAILEAKVSNEATHLDESRLYFAVLSAILVDGDECASSKTEANLGTQKFMSASASCAYELTKGKHIIRFVGSAWTNIYDAGPKFVNGRLNYIIYTR